MAWKGMYLFLLWTFIKHSSSTGSMLSLLNEHRSGIAPLVEAEVPVRTDKESPSVDPFEDEMSGKMSLYYKTTGEDKEEAFKKVVQIFLQFAGKKKEELNYTRRVEVEGKYFKCTNDRMDYGALADILFCKTDDGESKEVVIKVLRINEPELKTRLEQETESYKLLGKNPAVPTLIANGPLHGYKINQNNESDDKWPYHEKYGIVIEKYGINVHSLHSFCNCKFSRRTTLALGLEMNNAYESFGDKNVEFVHVDVKAENMLYSAEDDSHHLKLVDFEYSVKHRGEVPWFQGTSYCISRNLINFGPHHAFLTDDIESMHSVLGSFWYGKLAWDDEEVEFARVVDLVTDQVKKAGKDLTDAEIKLLTDQIEKAGKDLKDAKIKEGPLLFSEVPGLHEFTQYIYKNTDLYITPAYGSIKEWLNIAIKRYGIASTEEMDWIRRPKMLFECKDILTVNIIHEEREEKCHAFVVEFEPYYNSTLKTLKSKYAKVEMSDILHVEENQAKPGQVLFTEKIRKNEIAKLSYLSFDDSKFSNIDYYKHIYVKFDYMEDKENEEYYLVSMTIKGCLQMWDENSPLNQAINEVKLRQMPADRVKKLQEVEDTLQKVKVTVENTAVANVLAFKEALGKITPNTHEELLANIKSKKFLHWGCSWHLQPENKLDVTFFFEKNNSKI